MTMFESTTTNTFHKYFPDQPCPKTASFSSLELPSGGFCCQHFSVSRLASEILRWVDSGSMEFGLHSNTRRITHAIRNQRPLQFAHIERLGSDGDGVQKEQEGLHSAAREAKAKSSWNDMPKFLLAGAVSTVISRTCVAPLERIKLECMIRGSGETVVKIFQLVWISEGLRGFWKGNALNLFRMVPFKSINFICYDMYLDHLLRLPEKKEITNHDRLIGGGISGVLATAICIPLDTIRTRLVARGGETLGGVTGCFHHMIRKEGFFSLYKGLTPALLSMGPASAIFYSVYDILKTSYLSRINKSKEGNELGPVRALIYGAIAGACAETVTYPLEVIRRQLQLHQSTNFGLFSAFIKLIENDGIGSLFSGLIPSTLQVLPSAALSYYFYEMMKSSLKIN